MRQIIEDTYRFALPEQQEVERKKLDEQQAKDKQHLAEQQEKDLQEEENRLEKEAYDVQIEKDIAQAQVDQKRKEEEDAKAAASKL